VKKGIHALRGFVQKGLERMSNKRDEILIQVSPCEMADIEDFVREHMQGFAYHLDSWPEERLVDHQKYLIRVAGQRAGYAVIQDRSIEYFYVNQENFRKASLILESLIKEKDILSIFVMTQDSLVSALVAEWDYDKEMVSCGFADAGKGIRQEVLDEGETFRKAALKDLEGIVKMSGDFFDEPGAGYGSLEERIEAGIIFVLTEKEKLMGAGIMERSQLFKGTVSIGMYTSADFRKKGVARKILLNLKNQAYDQGLRPVAGCWYYNTLSRMSLEASGMLVTSVGFLAMLKNKEILPLRTGNPPGEPVE